MSTTKTLKEVQEESYNNWYKKKSDRDFIEDFGQENGSYENQCSDCKLTFIGNKHRHYCKLCHNKVGKKMKEISDVEELEVGAYYYLFDKQTNKFEGLQKLEWDGHSVLSEVIDEKDVKHFNVKCAHFPNRFWTHVGNNQGMERWHIFGPIRPPKPPTIELMRESVKLEKTFREFYREEIDDSVTVVNIDFKTS